MTANLPGWVRALALLVPGDIRREFRADLEADRYEMCERGVSPLMMNLAAGRDLLAGFAQYAPLRPVVAGTSPKPRVALRAALGGWIGWRIAGPALLIGYVLGSTLLIVLGGLLLAGAFGCLVTVAATAENPLPPREGRLVAAILGGTLATLFLTLVFGVLTIGLLAIASIFSSGLLMGLAVKALVLVTTASLAGITGSGWVPEEYSPKRLYTNDDVAPSAVGRIVDEPLEYEPEQDHAVAAR
jgi:hypothetical protein